MLQPEPLDRLRNVFRLLGVQIARASAVDRAPVQWRVHTLPITMKVAVRRPQHSIGWGNERSGTRCNFRSPISDFTAKASPEGQGWRIHSGKVFSRIVRA